MTDEIQINDVAIAEIPILTQAEKGAIALEELNLKVAAIAGWINIAPWRDRSKTLVGTNMMRPELGKFVPVYTKDLGAIFDVVTRRMGELKASFGVQNFPALYYSPPGKPYLAYGYGYNFYEATPALALCRLLLAIAPILSNTESEVKSIDEPTVFEATFE